MSLALVFLLLHSTWDQQRPSRSQLAEIVHMNEAGSKGLDGRFDLRHVLGQIPADLQQDCRSALSS